MSMRCLGDRVGTYRATPINDGFCLNKQRTAPLTLNHRPTKIRPNFAVSGRFWRDAQSPIYGAFTSVLCDLIFGGSIPTR